MQYIITDSSVIKLNETQGTIQNCGNSAIEVSNSADFSDSLLLFPQNKSTFDKGLYIRAYNEDTQPIEVNVVPFFFVNSGGGGVSGEEIEQLSATSFKAAAVNNNRVSFYTTSDTSGTAAFAFDFPEEMFLDQAGTELVSNFVWSALIYPDSTNPNLNGKTVLVLAVKGDKETNPTVKYSFVDVSKLIDIYTAADNTIAIENNEISVKVSSVANNAIAKLSDGLHVDISNKVDKVDGKGLSTNDYTTAEKTKLAGVAENANNYSLPDATSSTKGGVKIGSNINVSSGTISLTKDNVTNALGYTPPTTNTTYNVATTSANGLMSSSDKAKLDGVATGAQVNVIESVKVNGSALSVSNKTVDITVASADVTNKVDKVANATAGNLVILTADGNVKDSGVFINKVYRLRYGYRIKKDESDPDARVEYLYDAVGMTPAKMNFETDEFEYGSWKNVWFVKDCKPLMLKTDGTVDYYLYENDYSIKANGSDVTVASNASDSGSDVANTDYDGNAMVQIPLCWVKRYEDGDYVYEIVSNAKIDDNYHAYAHTNANGDIRDYFYYSMFDGSGGESRIRSLAGKTVVESVSVATMVQGATGNGDGWYIHCWCQRELIRTLCVLLGKSTDTKTVFGTGRATGFKNSSIATGTITKKGMFYGISANTSAVKVFHIENFWGNQGDRTAGLILNCTDNYAYVKMTPEGEGYRLTDVTGMTKTRAFLNVGTNGYIRSCKAAVEGEDDFGVIPFMSDGGSATTYYCDGYLRRSGSAHPSGDIGYLIAGGNTGNATPFSGAFAFHVVYSPLYEYWSIGCGLSYIG